MKNNQVAISGMGCISAAGKDIAETLQTFERGNVNVGKITLFETELDKPVFEVGDYAQKCKNRTMSLLLSALEEAVKNYDGDISDGNKRVGVCFDCRFFRNYREPLSGKGIQTYGNIFCCPI